MLQIIFCNSVYNMKQHHYSLTVNWTGNTGTGTSGYKKYDRSHEIFIGGKELINGSSDPSFNGDKSKWNPEELLVASVSSCHMLWYLHFCADAGIVVIDYKDEPKGMMLESENGGGKFEEIILYPTVTVLLEAMQETALSLHKKANEYCFIANSLNFKISHKPLIRIN